MQIQQKKISCCYYEKNKAQKYYLGLQIRQDDYNWFRKLIWCREGSQGCHQRCFKSFEFKAKDGWFQDYKHRCQRRLGLQDWHWQTLRRTSCGTKLKFSRSGLQTNGKCQVSFDFRFRKGCLYRCKDKRRHW